MTDAPTLAAARRASLTAPAGTGKTELIAKAVAEHGGRRELVLTHTHAGVEALRRRISKYARASGSFEVHTIAGWVLRYAGAFPASSRVPNGVPANQAAWDQAYAAVDRLLDRSPIKEIVRASYSGIFVDEYQDCTVGQHAIIMKLGAIVPVRILGDPLQGIFDFGRNTPVQWDRDVTPNFPPLVPLAEPWRWNNSNRDLGRWLAAARTELEGGRSINLVGAPITWIQIPQQNPVGVMVNACFNLAQNSQGSIVAIHKMPQQCHYVGGRLSGLFQCIEPIDSVDLSAAAQAIDQANGAGKAVALIDFASKCQTKVKTDLKRIRTAFSNGAEPNVRAANLLAAANALTTLSRSNSLPDALSALAVLKTFPGAVLFRRELFEEMQRSLRLVIAGEATSLKDAVWQARNRTRFSGRRVGRCIIGRTLLVKGLEFDHCVLLDADGLGAKDLYVALTRGARSLTVLSRAQTISPAN
jgi:DNA helicase-2/ATP-dependent DNA helicase PcrA